VRASLLFTLVRNIKSLLGRYGIPLLAFAVVTTVALILKSVFTLGLSVAILDIGVMIGAAWYTGRGPALMVDILFEALVDSNAISSGQPVRPVALAIQLISRQALFIPLILLASSRRQSESRLREQRRWFQGTLASIGDAVIATDATGRIMFMNPVAESLTGWREAEVLGKPLDAVFEVLNEYTRERVESPVTRVLREGVVVGLANHTVLLQKNGATIAIDDSGAPIKGPQGEIQGVVLVFRDVVERRRTEKALSSTTEQLRLVTDAMAAPVTHCSRDLRYLWVSRPFAEWLSRSPEEIIGRPIVEVMGREGFDQIHPYIERVLAGEVVRYEEQVPFKNLGLRWIDAVYTPTFDEQGIPDGWVAVVIDVDERKRMEQTLESANRAKDEFLAVVSHELRTPLNAMMGWSKMLRGRKLDQQTTERALEAIERNAEAQTRLIEDLLDISRVISGKLRLEVTELDPSSVVQAAIESIRPAAAAKGVRLQAVLDPSAGFVSGDPNRLQQVVWNLLSNAVKFTLKGGRVQIDLRRVQSHIEIIVSDTGKGISADFLPHVFDRFRQADGTLTRAQGGLGLGLAIVRNLVELHGGAVHVESAGENQGATFTVELPLMVSRSSGRLSAFAEVAEPVQEQSSTLECPSVIDGLHVLVVDDELDARALLTAILQHCRATVTAVESAGEAMRVLESQQPDIIVSDIGMPGQDGYLFIRQVRQWEAGRQSLRIPAVALTAHARAEDRVRALSSGYQSHVAKPVDPVELMAVIASLVTRRMASH
jgi:PAS domain S-box-containing protein